jgi:hypothetical protein
LLDPVRKGVPDPPLPQIFFTADNTPFIEVEIMGLHKDIFMNIAEMRKRMFWIFGLKNIEQETEHSYVGSVHYLIFDDTRVQVSPLKMVMNDSTILYSETATVVGMDITVIYEYKLTNTKNGTCIVACRIFPEERRHLSQELKSYIYDNQKLSLEKLKAFVEAGSGRESNEMVVNASNRQ